MAIVQRKPIEDIVRLEWGRSTKRGLFDNAMELIKKGVGKEFAEEKDWMWKRLYAQHRLEHGQEMTQEHLDYMVADRDRKGQVGTRYRLVPLALRDSRTGKVMASVYGSLLDVKGEPMMFMGYSAKKGFRDLNDRTMRAVLNELRARINKYSLQLYGKPLAYAAIEIEPNQRKDRHLAKWAMEELGAYPLALKEPGYTQPGIDLELGEKVAQEPQKLLFLFGDLRKKATLEEARNKSFGRRLVRDVGYTIIDQEYREFTPLGPALTPKTSQAFQNLLKSLKGVERVGYDLSQLNWIYRK